LTKDILLENSIWEDLIIDDSKQGVEKVTTVNAATMHNNYGIYIVKRDFDGHEYILW
jgi:hypothetical protein